MPNVIITYQKREDAAINEIDILPHCTDFLYHATGQIITLIATGNIPYEMRIICADTPDLNTS